MTLQLALMEKPGCWKGCKSWQNMLNHFRDICFYILLIITKAHCYIDGVDTHNWLGIIALWLATNNIFQIPGKVRKLWQTTTVDQWKYGVTDQYRLTHWGRVTHICVSKLTIIGSDNGLSPGRRQAIIWTIAGILLIGPLGTNFIEIIVGIQTISFRKMHLKMSSAL